jgi:phosphoribosylanthranilate isomerase
MVKVKICGITNVEDALWAASLGADYIGLNFCKSSIRNISAENAKGIVEKLPYFVIPVGVFVDEDENRIQKIVKKTNIKIIQLHGNETPEKCRRIKEMLSLPVIKAFKVKDETIIETIRNYLLDIDYILLDTYVEGMDGGTGVVFNWDIAAKISKEYEKPVFLAGGITPENVVSAIEKVSPYGIDVASGVERSPRRKDYDKMRSLILSAKGL